MLVNALRERGFNARQVLQEHSYVSDMWRQIANPGVLIYLDAGIETVRARRDDPEWPEWLLMQEIERLRHAREHCDLYLETDSLTSDEVIEQVLAFLETRQVPGTFIVPDE
jgi:hypothetical protein